MRAIRSVIVLTALVLMVGSAGIAATTESLSASSSADQSSLVKCSVSPSNVNVGDTVTATDTGSTAPSGSTLDNKQTFFWGDGTHTDTTNGSATHRYTSAGTFQVEETIYGNFGDGHETDECTGSPVTVGPPTNGGTATVKCSVSPSDVHVGDTVTATDTGSTAPSGSTLDAKKTFFWGDGTHTDTTTGSATHKYSSTGTFRVDETVYGNFGDGHETGQCSGSPVKVSAAPPTCPDNELSAKPAFGACEFSGATFYAAETDPMKVSVDASAVNAPSTSKSGNDPIAGAKITTTNCAASLNACDAVTNRDADNDITNYLWAFTAYRGNSQNQAVAIEQHVVDSGTSPSAAAQFTKTQGDDVIRIVLTITEKDEGTTTFTTPMPIFPIFSDDAVTKADLPPTPTTLGNVIFEPCDHGGLVTAPETLGDTLGDAAAPVLVDPNVQGPLSSAIEQNTVGSPIGSIGNEVACVVSALPGGAL